MASKSTNIEARCVKQAWVLEALAAEDTLADSTSAAELEQHLSTCSSCHKLAGRVSAVTVGLASLTSIGPGADLLGKATTQATQALQTGGQFTGRVDIPFGQDAALRRVWPWSKIGVFAIVTIVIIAFSTVWLSGYRRAHEPIEQLDHQSPSTNTIQNPWSAFGNRSTKEMDRAADIEPPTSQQNTSITKPTSKAGQSSSELKAPKTSDSANPSPERD